MSGCSSSEMKYLVGWLVPESYGRCSDLAGGRRVVVKTCEVILWLMVTPLLGTGSLLAVTRNMLVAAWWLPVGPRRMLPSSWQSSSRLESNELELIGNDSVCVRLGRLRIRAPCGSLMDVGVLVRQLLRKLRTCRLAGYR